MTIALRPRTVAVSLALSCAGVLTAATLAGPAGAASATPAAVDDNLDACPGSRVLDPNFSDDDGNFFEQEIACLYDYGIAAGRTAGTYDPLGKVLRVHLAVFVYRLLDGMGFAPPDTTDHGFTDLGALTAEQRDAVNALANAGVLHGVDSTHFRPGRAVTRAQMASYLAGAQKLVDDGFAAAGDYFDDDQGDLHEDAINAIASVGITAGTGVPGAYGPNRSVTRSQMAGYLARDLQVNIARGNVESLFVDDQDFAVRASGDVTRAPGGAATRYTFTSVPDGSGYVAALFPCSAVTNGSDTAPNPFTDVFDDKDGNGEADGLGTTDGDTAVIAAVDGAAVGARSRTGITAAGGTITVDVSSDGQDCAVPVLFADTNGDGGLTLDGNEQPTEPYAAPAELWFVTG